MSEITARAFLLAWFEGPAGVRYRREQGLGRAGYRVIRRLIAKQPDDIDAWDLPMENLPEFIRTVKQLLAAAKGQGS